MKALWFFGKMGYAFLGGKDVLLGSRRRLYFLLLLLCRYPPPVPVIALSGRIFFFGTYIIYLDESFPVFVASHFLY